MKKKQPRKKPRDLSLGDCSEATLRSAHGEVASVGGKGWLADCNIPMLQFQAGRATHIARMRRLADWLMEAALWLEKEAEKGK